MSPQSTGRTTGDGSIEPGGVDSYKDLAACNAALLDALAYQSATNEILEAIRRSPSDAKPVFDAIVESAARLCDAEFSAVARFDGNLLHLVSVSNMSPKETEAYMSVFPRPPNRSFIMGRAFVDRAPVQVEDVTKDPNYDAKTLATLQRAAPYRTYLGIPIICRGTSVWSIGLGRRRIEAFTERQIKLVQTFAGQAVIAIENARLFTELEDRTRDLTEALKQESATADVLKIISRSSFDLQSELDTLIESATDLCGAKRGHIF